MSRLALALDWMGRQAKPMVITLRVPGLVLSAEPESRLRNRYRHETFRQSSFPRIAFQIPMPSAEFHECRAKRTT